MRNQLGGAASRNPLNWLPTHWVPAGGLPALDRPDVRGVPIANLPPGLGLISGERSGYWVHVLAENGWHGWVDSRQLPEMLWYGTPAQATARHRAGLTLVAFGVVVLVAVVGVMLLGGGSSSAASAGVTSGRWIGTNSGTANGELEVDFQIVGGTTAEGITISFFDTTGGSAIWRCPDVQVGDGGFSPANCTSSDPTSTVDVEGQFTSSTSISGTYTLTENSGGYEGVWDGASQ